VLRPGLIHFLAALLALAIALAAAAAAHLAVGAPDAPGMLDPYPHALGALTAKCARETGAVGAGGGGASIMPICGRGSAAVVALERLINRHNARVRAAKECK
jgi:hypothetical protein